MPTKTETAIQIIAARGGTVRTREALSAGIHPRTLYALRDSGRLIQLARGLYRLSDLPPVGDPDLALVAGRIPQGVVCLISALAIYGVMTQISREIHLAISRKARYPALDEVPLAVYRFSQQSFSAGVTDHDIGGASVRVFDAEKSIAEKFEAMIKLGELNSRMKDFFDIWSLARNQTFDGGMLSEAIARTFRRRGTVMDANAVCFEDTFGNSETKQTQWRGFLKRTQLAESAPALLVDVWRDVMAFLRPMITPSSGTSHWLPGGPWGSA